VPSLSTSEPIEFFDFLAYFDSRGIQYWTEGKNVSPGWVGIQCLWCGDKSNHLGINIDSKKFKCFKCKRKGLITSIVKEIEGCSTAAAHTLMREFLDYTMNNIRTRTVKNREYDGPILPEGATTEFLPIYLEYLEKRGFDPEKVIPKYQLMMCHRNTKNYNYRILIPIFMYGQLVSFTTRSISDSSDQRYKNCPDYRALRPSKELIYNLDTVNHTALLVEGPADVWRMGDGACSVLGTEISVSQINMIVQKNVRRAFVLFDPEPEAQALAEHFCNNLSAFIPEVFNLELEGAEDPGAMSDEDAKYLRQDLGL